MSFYGVDDDDLLTKYEDGQWEWNDDQDCLVFKRNETDYKNLNSKFEALRVITLGTEHQFRDTLDELEQNRFKRKYARKTEENDVIRMQDIRDLVIYTATMSLLSKTIIIILHTPITERLIRSLIIYCQYYLEVSRDIIAGELELKSSKIAHPNTDKRRNRYEQDLQDLRLLVATQYSCFLLKGNKDLDKLYKSGSSITYGHILKHDARIFESFLRILLQIVWLALGRQSFKILGIEIQRLFKTQIYNMLLRLEETISLQEVTATKHSSQKMLYGKCVKKASMLKSTSPLIDELVCDKRKDFRYFGLGVMNFPILSPRLKYLENVLSCPEENLKNTDVKLGILGLPRKDYDAVLKKINIPSQSSDQSNASRSYTASSVGSVKRRSLSRRKSTMSSLVVNEIAQVGIIPPEVKSKDRQHYQLEFPSSLLPEAPINMIQCDMWLERLQRYQKN